MSAKAPDQTTSCLISAATHHSEGIAGALRIRRRKFLRLINLALQHVALHIQRLDGLRRFTHRDSFPALFRASLQRRGLILAPGAPTFIPAAARLLVLLVVVYAIPVQVLVVESRRFTFTRAYSLDVRRGPSDCAKTFLSSYVFFFFFLQSTLAVSEDTRTDVRAKTRK